MSVSCMCYCGSESVTACVLSHSREPSWHIARACGMTPDTAFQTGESVRYSQAPWAYMVCSNFIQLLLCWTPGSAIALALNTESCRMRNGARSKSLGNWKVTCQSRGPAVLIRHINVQTAPNINPVMGINSTADLNPAYLDDQKKKKKDLIFSSLLFLPVWVRFQLEVLKNHVKGQPWPPSSRLEAPESSCKKPSLQVFKPNWHGAQNLPRHSLYS